MSPDHDGLPNSAEPAPTNAGDTAARLLTIMRELLLEIRQSERDVPTLTLDSHIDRDLALDSLARTELLQRIERNFRVQLDEKVLLAESPRDLLELILRASGQPPEATTLAPDWQAPTAQQAATVGPPDGAETLIDMLDWHVGRQPERVAIQIYGNDDRIDTAFTYAGLRQRARAVATGLRERGLQPRQTAAIMLPTGPEYFLAFFGILLAGAAVRS